MSYYLWLLILFGIYNSLMLKILLHGDLKEEVYMEPPLGFRENFGDNKVCKLKKALWTETVSKSMVQKIYKSHASNRLQTETTRAHSLY